jgi:hypothetical protein
VSQGVVLQERHSLRGPMLLGFIPVVSGQGTKIAQARLRLYQFCMSTLIQDLKTACGGLRFHAHFGTLTTACRLYVCSHRYSTIAIGAEPELECRVCYPLLLAFEADHPETKMCCCLKGGTTKLPCNMCHEAHKNLHKLKPEQEPCARSHLDLDRYFAESRAFADMERNLAHLLERKEITKSRHDNMMKQAREKLQSERNLLHTFSAHDLEPAFSELGYLDPYQAMAIDLMHLLDLGLVPRMLLLTARHWHCERKRQGGVNELNDMWCAIASDSSSRPDDLHRIIKGPLFKYEKKNKIEVASVLKAEEYRAVLQLFPHLVACEPLVYAVWVGLQDFYAKAHQGSFTTKSMIELDAAASRCIARLPMRSLSSSCVMRPSISIARVSSICVPQAARGLREIAAEHMRSRQQQVQQGGAAQRRAACGQVRCVRRGRETQAASSAVLDGGVRQHVPYQLPRLARARTK